MILYISKLKREISIYEVLLRNEGRENVRIDDFDTSLDFGLAIKGDEILESPEIIESSDNEYYKCIRLLFKK